MTATPVHEDSIAGPTTLMVGARLVNLAVGLVSIPILIHYLGGTGFAAWAILLALAAGFTLLEIGSPTVVRFLVLPVARGDWNEVRSILGSVWILEAFSYGAALCLSLWIADPLASWLRLPAMGSITANQAVCGVLIATGVRAFLQSGTYTLYAGQRFMPVAVIALLQPLLSNLAAIVTAWKYSRLDITLASYWTMQLCVVGAAFFWFGRHCLPRFVEGAFRPSRLRELWIYNLHTQLHQWAQFVNFQFDKFIIAGLAGLWAVAPYEVANRAVLALRSIPASGEEVLLPAAVKRRASPEEAWNWYSASTRFAGYGVCVFMLAPLAIAPVFLYAWTGEMGYVGRWAFVALILGAVANMLAMPAATLIQAAGLPGIPARMAVISILLNIPVSLLLVTRWGLTGAAIGTGAVMVLSAVLLLRAVHQHFNKPLAPTLGALAKFFPLVLVCAAWGSVTYFLFSTWFATLEPSARFSRYTRLYPGVMALAVYGACVISMIIVEVKRGALTSEEWARFVRTMKVRWFFERNS